MSIRRPHTASALNRLVSPPIDRGQLLRACGEDRALAQQLLYDMESILKSQIKRIIQHAVDDDFCIAAETAHSLKGAAAILGAEPLRLAACAVERAAKMKNKVNLQAAAVDIRAAARTLIEFIPKVFTVSA